MALQLSRASKGVQANYWKITHSSYSVFGNQTSLTLALYISKETRDAGLNNFLETETFQFDGFLTQAEMYAKIKESKIGKREITPAVYEETTLITPAVTEEYETNVFVSAIDV